MILYACFFFFFLFLFLLYARFLEPGKCSTRILHIPLPNDVYPPGTLTLLHLTDFHFGKYPERDLRLIRQLHRSPPADILFLTGDYVEHSDGLLSMEILLREFSFPLGMFAVWGNNDGFRKEALSRLFQKHGVRILENETVSLSLERLGVKIPLSITGLNDPHYFKAVFPEVGPAKGIRVLLAHSSEFLLVDDIPDFDVIFTGHTHGGQLALPFVGPIFSNLRLGCRWARGVFKTPHGILITSAGIGTSALPLRFLVPPEVILAHLVSVKDNGVSVPPPLQ